MQVATLWGRDRSAAAAACAASAPRLLPARSSVLALALQRSLPTSATRYLFSTAVGDSGSSRGAVLRASRPGGWSGPLPPRLRQARPVEAPVVERDCPLDGGGGRGTSPAPVTAAYVHLPPTSEGGEGESGRAFSVWRSPPRWHAPHCKLPSAAERSRPVDSPVGHCRGPSVCGAWRGERREPPRLLLLLRARWGRGRGEGTSVLCLGFTAAVACVTQGVVRRGSTMLH